jgi:glycosyltransferase involved in cell wall biosynthesis
MPDGVDISVIIATHNRARILDDTLRHMAQLDHEGINIEFAIVDNNSTDETSDVIERARQYLPIRHLFEASPGQNYARNRALADVPLGEIVVFTDDDIRPCRDWFGIISSACRRWPQYDVFGGRIHPIWPDEHRPQWTEIRLIQELGFAYHDYADHEAPYAAEMYPSSGNLWTRRRALSNGIRFDESIEWHPGNRIMATETIFLKHLIENGRRVMHCPEAIVGHKITAEQVSLLYVLKRAYSWGRGMAHIRGLCRKRTLRRNRTWWYCMRYGAIARLGVKLATSMTAMAVGRPRSAMHAMQWLGFNVEQLRLAPYCNERKWAGG